MSPFVENLNTPMLRLSKDRYLDLRAFHTGIHAFGAPGAGKTTALGHAVCSVLYRSGAGGIAACIKPDEIARQLKYARDNGRAQDVVVVDENVGMNPLMCELLRQPGMLGVGNAVELMMRIFQFCRAATGGTEGGSEAFFEEAIRMLLNHSIPAIYSAHGEVTISNILDFVTSAATQSGDQYNDEAWARDKYAAQTLAKLLTDPVVPMDGHLQAKVFDYWMNQWPATPIKTLGNIVVTLTARLDRFKHGRLAKCFGGNTDAMPEQTFMGTIFILAMPVLSWNEDGRIGQQIWKLLFQRAVDSRNGLPEIFQKRTVFMIADESHYLLHPKDAEFLSTCRSSRACVFFMSQNLPSYTAALGPQKADVVTSLIGKFSTHFFFSSGCAATNEFASKLIGRGIHWRKSRGTNKGTTVSGGMTMGNSTGESYAGGGWFGTRTSTEGGNTGATRGNGKTEGSTEGASEALDFIIEPNVFARELRTGGPDNDFRVTGVVFKAGARFKGTNGDNYLFVTFKQEVK